MKKSKFLILAAMLASTALSWVCVIRNSDSISREYDKYICAAQNHEKKQAYITAAENYKKALELDPGNYDLIIKTAENYYMCDEKNSFVQYCNMALSADSMQSKPYLLMSEYYCQRDEYSTALKLLLSAPQKNDIVQKIQSIKYVYKTGYKTFAKVSGFYKGYSSVQSEKGKWGITDTSGHTVLPYKYDEIGGAYDSQNDIVPVCYEGQWYFADIMGRKKYVPDRNCSFIGSYSCGYSPFKHEEKYGYMNLDYEEFNFEYDFAGAFSEETAAVMKNGKWALIDNKFNNITEFEYDSIELDKYGFCLSNGVIHAVKDGENICLDHNGKVTKEKNNYICGLKPCSEEGYWGYCNTDSEFAIDAMYEETLPFTADGSAFVKEKGMWYIISLKVYQNQNIL